MKEINDIYKEFDKALADVLADAMSATRPDASDSSDRSDRPDRPDGSDGLDWSDPVGCNLPEIPAEYAERIDAALESEMAASRTAPTSVWKRCLLAISGAAAVIAAVWFAVTPLFRQPDAKPMLAVTTVTGKHPATNPATTSPTPVTTPTPATQPAATQPAATQSPAPLPSGLDCGANGVSTSASSAASASPTRHARTASPPTQTDLDPDADLYLSEDEEEQLIAANYRVVTSPDEAQAIICGVIGDLETNMAIEQYRMSEIIDKYDSEINNLY